VLPLFFAGVLHASSTNLLPGITLYDGTEKLTGKLVFLLQHQKKLGEFDIPTNGLGAASIYEYDFSKKSFRKITDSPFGHFSTSRDGDAFCVSYWLGEWHQGNDTNVFIYSKSSGLSRILSLESSPGEIAFAGGYAFFELRGYNFKNPGFYVTDGQSVATKIIACDIAKDKTWPIEFKDSSQWEFQNYDHIYLPQGLTNFLRFEYHGLGKRIGEGKDYTNGPYRYEISSGTIQYIPALHPVMHNLENGFLDKADYDRQIEKWTPFKALEEEDNRYHYKTFNGDDIGFDSNEPSLIPEGFTLMTASADSERVLHRFSKLKWALDGAFGMEYTLDQMSPDRHYALVCEGTLHTYYIVDVSTGKTRLLFKTDKSISRLIWGFQWVQDGQ
jgi:hypothetical protein